MSTSTIQIDREHLEALKRERDGLRSEVRRLAFALEMRPTSAQQQLKQAVADRVGDLHPELCNWQRSNAKRELTNAIKWQLHLKNIREFKDEHLEEALQIIAKWTDKKEEIE